VNITCGCVGKSYLNAVAPSTAKPNYWATAISHSSVSQTNLRWHCCDRKSRAACAQSFAPWQQATIEIMLAISLTIACSRYIYYGVILHAHPVRGESHNQRNTTGEVATALSRNSEKTSPTKTNPLQCETQARLQARCCKQNFLTRSQWVAQLGLWKTGESQWQACSIYAQSSETLQKGKSSGNFHKIFSRFTDTPKHAK